MRVGLSVFDCPDVVAMTTVVPSRGAFAGQDAFNTDEPYRLATYALGASGIWDARWILWWAATGPQMSIRSVP